MKRRELEKVFKNKFGLVPSEGAKHRLFIKRYKGEDIYSLPVSRGYSDISDDILNELADQCFSQLREFKKAIDCTISAEKFHDTTTTRWATKYSKNI